MGKSAVMDISDKKLSLSEVCREFSVSAATVKNWIKLGKIRPEKITEKIVFDKEYINQLKTKFKQSENNVLKTRRNKKFVSGNKIYNSYVLKNSPNLKTVKDITDFLNDKNIETDDVLISEIIADCARKLIKDSGKPFEKYKFLTEEICKTKKYISQLSEFNYKYIKDEDTLGLLYLSLKNMGERKSQGAYYTPVTIVKKLCSNLKIESGKTVYDPCCGTGNFILQLPDCVKYWDIYANDIDLMSVKIARINFALKYGITDKSFLVSHITNNDFLTCDDNKKYDFIIGNPPWGAEFTEKGKKDLKKRYKSAVGSNIESFDVVIENSLNFLNNNGILSFVLPESVLNVKSHTPVRKVISQSNSVKYLEYIGNPFDEVMCPGIIVQILHNNKPFDTKGMCVKKGGKSFTIKQSRKIDPNYFNFNLEDEWYSVLQKIENIPGKVSLKNNSGFALGIVTGDNKKYISEIKSAKNEPVIRGCDLEKYVYNTPKTYITFTPERFQQVAPVELYRSKEKLFYKFISSTLVFAYDNKQTLSLNSCNILIPEVKGLDIKYILAVLNSSAVQFYFKNRFNSVKVLRSHIENIPIPFADENVQQDIIKSVDKILKGSDVEKNIKAVDNKISELYGLSEKEKTILNVG